ncbi:MAG: imidazoleglycerol-phosphate dehydratase HisB [Thermomicrobia bacterium]|nr:imidazoleglycerol-phosphate dehydratase HisB [Thermomicrobia bacterium]MCA1723373.1 imidazoleglycerol-phosphate dehydratase HisB [Thermomicrobia bacterium]
MGAEARIGTVERETAETHVVVSIGIDGTGKTEIATGIGALDHFLTLWARHGLFDLEVAANGDLEVDGHHTVEDVGLCLGRAIGQALGERRGIRRAAHTIMPMDEALATTAVDLGGRGYFVLTGAFSATHVGTLETDLVRHFLLSLAMEARMNLHVLLHYGTNAHHEVEAIFKGFGRALDAATQIDPRLGDTVPSSKGVIES